MGWLGFGIVFVVVCGIELLFVLFEYSLCWILFLMVVLSVLVLVFCKLNVDLMILSSMVGSLEILMKVIVKVISM